MAEKKQDSFVVTDRRLFTSEGELRQETAKSRSRLPQQPQNRLPGEARPLG